MPCWGDGGEQGSRAQTPPPTPTRTPTNKKKKQFSEAICEVSSNLEKKLETTQSLAISIIRHMLAQSLSWSELPRRSCRSCRLFGPVVRRPLRKRQTWGRYHGGRRPSSDDSFHSPTVIPPSALDKPSIMKRDHRRRTCSHTSPGRSPTMVTLHDSRFVECLWWNDGWTVKTVVT